MKRRSGQTFGGRAKIKEAKAIATPSGNKVPKKFLDMKINYAKETYDASIDKPLRTA